MKAVGLTQYLPIDDPNSLVDLELPKPVAAGRDLLVNVRAISVNPLDTKIRISKEGMTEIAPRVLGWDAAGVVEATGTQVTGFKPGDEVYYAGDVTRPGSNAEFQLVDERIVGRKPRTLSFAEAAALPLTALTAWESIFVRLRLELPGRAAAAQAGKSLLIIGGAGGVGSIAIQIARHAGLKVIATASRPESTKWVLQLGAAHALDHRQPLGPQLEALGQTTVDFIANFNNTDDYWDTMAELITPQGRIVCIVENAAPIELGLLKSKSATFSWEFMFTRPVFQTPDMHRQAGILNTIAELIDAKRLQATHTETFSPINAANLRAAHAKIESGRTIGKIVLSGW